MAAVAGAVPLLAGEGESVGPPAGSDASGVPTTAAAQRSSTSTVTEAASPEFRPGAEANRSRWVEAFPVPVPTGRRIDVGSVTELNAAMGSVGPGDEIVLRAGTYDDEVTVSARGRAGSPITVRAVEPRAAVVVGNGSWNLSGEHLVVRDLRFDRTRGGTKGVVVTGRHIRLTQNRFDQVGYTADDTDKGSVIRMETDRDSFNLVDANEVDRPNTVFTYLSHGTGYTVYSHNVITGPNGMGGRYNSYLVKSGSAMDQRPSRTVFQYNTVLDWGLVDPRGDRRKDAGRRLRRQLDAGRGALPTSRVRKHGGRQPPLHVARRWRRPPDRGELVAGRPAVGQRSRTGADVHGGRGRLHAQ